MLSDLSDVRFEDDAMLVGLGLGIDGCFQEKK